MLDLSSHATELAPGVAPWHATGAHPVPPVSGSYILIDRSALLSAATPGHISAVLVLPQADDVDQDRLGPDAPAAYR